MYDETASKFEHIMKKNTILLTTLLVFNLAQAETKNTSREKPIIVAAMGDIADCRPGQEDGVKKTSKIMDDVKPDFFFPLGDLVYPEATKREMSNCYGKYFSKYNNITFPTVGNHEYYSENGKNYFEYFSNNVKKLDSMDNSSRSKAKVWPKYYRFDYRGWTFISVDTNKNEENDIKQLEWLEKTYKTKNKCTILMMHHPYISKGLRPIKEESKKVIEKIRDNPPTIVLTGHDHHYEESTNINGTKHYLIGSGGVKINTFVNPLSLNNEYTSFKHGLVKLELYDNKYVAKFITEDGVERTSYGTCSGE